jgi:hypothetical protein
MWLWVGWPGMVFRLVRMRDFHAFAACSLAQP